MQPQGRHSVSDAYLYRGCANLPTQTFEFQPPRSGSQKPCPRDAGFARTKANKGEHIKKQGENRQLRQEGVKREQRRALPIASLSIDLSMLCPAFDSHACAACSWNI